ncbi:hypothetical protein LTR08_008994 [Meristemomyces frigidus]|nr:hypothetical protein LTR08_008994 [Meristemomyces frigidus]
MTAISQILSQHGMLTTLCSHLSAADIVHLAATSKEHRTYISSNKPLFNKYLASAICDGLGVVARARVFGEANGDPLHVKQECLGADAKPCSDCSAPVCDNCRFHFYSDWSKELEREVAGDDWRDGMKHCFDNQCSVTSRRAFDIFAEQRRQFFCEDCHPLWTPLTNEYQRCRCDFYDHFVGKRWLCLPCFFVEETKAAKVKVSRTVAYTPMGPWPRYVYIEEGVCDCGKPAMHQSDEACRVCHLAVRAYPENDRDIILPKILAQLG